MVAKRHKITNVPLFKKIWDIIIFFGDNNFLSHFSGHFEGASTCPAKKILSRIFLNSGTLIVNILGMGNYNSDKNFNYIFLD
jgi:hypothetical protein